MGMLPGAEGVTVNIELSINRCWPRTRECHCSLLWCSGAVVQWSCTRMVLWSNQKRRVVAPCKGRRLQIPVGKGPTDWPRTFDPPFIPHHIHGKRLPQHMRLPHKVLDPTSSVSESNRDRWKWRSSVMSMFALVSTTTIAPKLVLLSNLSGCRDHGHVL